MKAAWAAMLRLAALTLALAACAPGPGADPRLDGTLWVRTSAEYRMAAVGAYRLAAARLEAALADRRWTAALEQSGDFARLPPAVILDVDETVLDNAPFQARLVAKGARFTPEGWAAWVARAEAEAVPGAREFVAFARARGVRIFYVTNRDRSGEAATRRNLEARGFPVLSAPDTLLMRNERPNWGADKASRRRAVARRHRVLLLIGDDANDFLPGTRAAPAERRAAAAVHEAWWGERWILLPNPVYGGWERALYGFKRGLSEAERRRRKRAWLRGGE